MFIEIFNDYISMSIDTFGANMHSIIDKKNNEELLYQVEPKSWQRQDVVVFPFTGKLLEGTYTYEGKTYALENHGFARFFEYKIEKQEQDYLLLSLHSNEETLKMYPFNFIFYASFRLIKNSVEVKYIVNNLDDKKMYFGLGGHPAFKVNAIEREDGTDISGNYIAFDKEINKVQYILEDSGSFIKEVVKEGTISQFEITRELIDKYKIFMLNANEVKELYLKRKDGRIITFVFDNKINYLAFWTFAKYGAYFTIEPWMTLQDFVDAEKDITKKKNILSLNSKEDYELSYLIVI